MEQQIQSLKNAFPWPEKPSIGPKTHGWFYPEIIKFLGPLMKAKRVVVELGSWYGSSASWMASRHPENTIICIDTWAGDPNVLKHSSKKMVAESYDRFICNLWHYKDRVIPIKKDTISGMLAVHDAKVQPDIVYIDASHDILSVFSDIYFASLLFPKALICGDDSTMLDVQLGIAHACTKTNRFCCIGTRVWFLKPNREGCLSLEELLA